MQKIALRMDDVGASTKRYNIHARRDLRVAGFRLSGNFLFLKYLRSIRGWGPYSELGRTDWLRIFDLLQRTGARMTVAVTACWVEGETRLIPFPSKFPAQAGLLKEGVESGLIEVANHGLTHCVLEDNAFKPRLFHSNRTSHREFGDYLSAQMHREHILRSQEILEGWLGRPVVTFTPPGNLFNQATVDAAKEAGISYLCCNCATDLSCRPALIGDEHCLPFHDRDIALSGVGWLENLIIEHQDKQLTTVADIGDGLQGAGGATC